MDTGGLAQMSYSNNNNNNNGYYANTGFGVPAASYGSRGKGAHMKRLSVAPSANMGSIDEDEADINPAPRTSRSHLLAGLRTAPRSAANVPSSAPHSQQRFGPDASSFAGRNYARSAQSPALTSTAASFPYMPVQNGYGLDGNQNIYSLPEQVLAPPDLRLGLDHADQMDPDVYNSLMQQNLYLMQRQQQLQQQLVNVQAAAAAANQMQSLSLNNHGYHVPAGSVTQGMSAYKQQAQNGLQPIVQPVPNQVGVYSVYNPMTGQHTIYYDQEQMLPSSPPPQAPAPGLQASSSPEPDGRQMYAKPSANNSATRFGVTRTSSPPKSTTSPQPEVTPLPPPSANAFRPNHRKSMSNFGATAPNGGALEGPKTADLRTTSFPRAPVTGSVGPGRARVGEHPTRQPRGPPPLDELVAGPTSKHQGSKNFAARRRRAAVQDLVRAGKERSGRSGSSDLGTPTSEGDIVFTQSSDADSEGGSSSVSGSGSLSGDPTFGSFKAAGAIGSERKGQKAAMPPFATRNSLESVMTSLGRTRDFAAAVKAPEVKSPVLDERRKNPLVVLASAAEKRKSLSR